MYICNLFRTCRSIPKSNFQKVSMGYKQKRVPRRRGKSLTPGLGLPHSSLCLPSSGPWLRQAAGRGVGPSQESKKPRHFPSFKTRPALFAHPPTEPDHSPLRPHPPIDERNETIEPPGPVNLKFQLVNCSFIGDQRAPHETRHPNPLFRSEQISRNGVQVDWCQRELPLCGPGNQHYQALLAAARGLRSTSSSAAKPPPPPSYDFQDRTAWTPPSYDLGLRTRGGEGGGASQLAAKPRSWDTLSTTTPHTHNAHIILPSSSCSQPLLLFPAHNPANISRSTGPPVVRPGPGRLLRHLPPAQHHRGAESCRRGC